MFDQKGNLHPYSILLFSVEEFEKKFLFSSRRKSIYRGYQDYCNDLLKIVSSMRHWIDGSFVTAKNEPNDIDVVCFIDHIYFKQEIFLNFDTKFSSFKVKKIYNVDSYIVFVFPKEHQYYEYYQERVEYWRKWFGQDRNENKKGIVELKYG